MLIYVKNLSKSEGVFPGEERVTGSASEIDVPEHDAPELDVPELHVPETEVPEPVPAHVPANVDDVLLVANIPYTNT